MPALLIRHRVSDYHVWQGVFAEQEYARTANGCQGARVFRNADDPGELLILLDWDSRLRARLFAQSDDLLESIGWGDGTSRPAICLLDDPPELT